MYAYGATVVRVLDGDTVILDVDLGFYMVARMSCRLVGINAREIHDDGGPEARDHLLGLIPVGTVVRIQSVKPDKYAGRFDGLINVQPGQSVNDRMVADGYAARWNGTGSRPVPPWPIPEPS